MRSKLEQTRENCVLNCYVISFLLQGKECIKTHVDEEEIEICSKDVALKIIIQAKCKQENKAK